MTWEARRARHREDPFAEYLRQFEGLIGDQRTGVTFGEVIKGIISAGSLVCEQIAAHSQLLARTTKGAQRVIRLAKGESTKRSQLDAASLTEQLRRCGLAELATSEADELWLMFDGSDLRKPYAEVMPDLMQVKDLSGRWVPGYRTLNVLGVTPQRRGVLYHRLFSSTEANFTSEPAEVQQALQCVHQALQAQSHWQSVTWVMDRAFDDVAVWRTIWEQQEHLVCRVKHTERLITYQQADEQWQTGDVAHAVEAMRVWTTVQTEMVTIRGRQVRPKAQRVKAKISACPLRLTYDSQVRREGTGTLLSKDLWLVEVRLVGTKLDPWLLITDWPVTDAESALRSFRMYRQRWAVEDSFKFTKQCLGWEDVQLLDLGQSRSYGKLKRGRRTASRKSWSRTGAEALILDADMERVVLLEEVEGDVTQDSKVVGAMIFS